ncbi:MAG: sensor histidine kinase [Lachnospiraceae bacterium]|nr:sensor histidine kinase [Lachnospiraceae bacterium]
MRLWDYIRDKAVYVLSFSIVCLIIGYLFAVFDVNMALSIIILMLLVCLGSFFIVYGYQRKRMFYCKLQNNIAKLDKAYLVLETLTRPEFYEGRLTFDALYDIDKSMAEHVGELERQNEDFKEYIEMWIHEVKIPLAALTLRAHNHPEEFERRTIEQIRRLDDYVEQILFYARSENAEQDYRIAGTSLAKVVKAVALKNKDELLENKIDFQVQDLDRMVQTDGKWLEFILNQMINNSIKYRKEQGETIIRIYAKECEEGTQLMIWDNGIGIPKEDLRRVFEKSFTGYNGRIKSKSTGMGLYIARELCGKLGHEIAVESVQGEFTKLVITFYRDRFFDVLEKEQPTNITNL